VKRIQMRLQNFAIFSFLLASVPALSGQDYIVNTESGCLRLRGAGNRNARVKDCISKNSIIQVLEAPGETGYARVQTEGGAKGYMYVPLLKPSAGRPSTEVTTAPPRAEPPAQTGERCQTRTLKFSADFFHDPAKLPANSVWGANATYRQPVIDPPFSNAFINTVAKAKSLCDETFAYLGGPCGDTGGTNDGESESCKRIHRSYNAKFASGTRDTAQDRWKPFTLKQMKLSKKYKIDHCEIDNLENESKNPEYKVNVPLIALFKEIKSLYDQGEIHCKLVLKNVTVAQMGQLKNAFPRPADASFISPFSIFETTTREYTQSLKSSLDAGIRALKGPGAVSILSTDTHHYGSSFGKKGQPDKFQTCSDRQPALVSNPQQVLAGTR
jgi:hypothetical protein